MSIDVQQATDPLDDDRVLFAGEGDVIRVPDADRPAWSADSDDDYQDQP